MRGEEVKEGEETGGGGREGKDADLRRRCSPSIRRRRPPSTREGKGRRRMRRWRATGKEGRGGEEGGRRRGRGDRGGRGVEEGVIWVVSELGI